MKEVLKNILDEVIRLDPDEYDNDDYVAAFYRFFCGYEDDYLYNKYMDQPKKFLQYSNENVVLLSLSPIQLKVLVFGDGYNGCKFTFGVENGKLKLLGSYEVDQNNPVFEEEDITEEVYEFITQQ